MTDVALFKCKISKTCSVNGSTDFDIFGSETKCFFVEFLVTDVEKNPMYFVVTMHVQDNATEQEKYT